MSPHARVNDEFSRADVFQESEIVRGRNAVSPHARVNDEFSRADVFQESEIVRGRNAVKIILFIKRHLR